MNTKIESVQSFLQQKSWDGLFITKSENIFWLSGFQGSFGFLLLTRSGDKYLITDSRYSGRAEPICTEQNFQFLLFDTKFKETFGAKLTGIFALENSLTQEEYEKIQTWFPSGRFETQSGVVESLRREKKPFELKQIEYAQSHVDSVFVPFLKSKLKSGITEQELAFDFEFALRDHGRFQLAFNIIIAFGENSAIPHHSPTDRKLKKGDNILVDCGVKHKGYQSDITRNFGFSSLSPAFQNQYAHLRSVQEQVLQDYIPGTKTKVLQETTKKLLGDKAEFFTHSLGHGIGLETHELPSFGLQSTDVLSENDVVTCEPGLYYPKKFGIRIEDLVHITHDKPRVLSQTTKDLLVF